MNPLDTVRNFLRNLLSGGQAVAAPIQTSSPNGQMGLQIEGNPTTPIKAGPGYTQPMMQPKGSVPTPTQGEGFRLSVPSQNGMYNLPPDIAQQIGNVFEPIGEATSAAQVLIHPKQQTRTKEEIKRLGENWNLGENPGMKVSNIDVPNNDGSIDRGLFRINNNTFNGMMKDPFWKNAMAKRGIKSWADMEDPNKNIQMAYLILARNNWDSKNNQVISNPNWSAWYAAPLDQRTR